MVVAGLLAEKVRSPLDIQALSLPPKVIGADVACF